MIPIIILIITGTIMGLAGAIPKKKIQDKLKVLSQVSAKAIEVTIHRFIPIGGEKFEEGVVITLFESASFYFTETVRILRSNNTPQGK